MSLLEEVEAARQDIRTDDYSMSIGEWISIYTSRELDVHPEFQRFFRWSEQQKSNLIESILLGIPLPPIFVSQRKNGVWDVIDGVQRLSTVFQFLGILRDEDDKQVPPLKLTRTIYLPSLDGIQWDSEIDESTLHEDLKRAFKRSKINVSIVLKESNEKTKFDLFQRLNTGGSELSAQEVRNCILVMINKEFYTWIRSLADNVAFKETTALSDKPMLESYDMEQVLRFLTLSDASDDELKSVGDVGVYLNAKMIELAGSPNYDKIVWENRFLNTFQTLSQSVGDDAFKRFSTAKKRHEGGFLVSQFEAVACGVSWNLQKGTLRNDLANAIQEIWTKPEFTDWVSSGVTAARRLRRIIPFARKHFSTP